ncbi:unnamed protein product [Rotaria magnacalcarata]
MFYLKFIKKPNGLTELESLGLFTESIISDIETCVYDELILLLLHRMLNLEKLHLCLTVGEKEHYHIYSYPYKLHYYDDITNNLLGGIFKYVRKVSLLDEHPFEHEFFLRIAQSFSMMENLTVRNEKRKINKRFRLDGIRVALVYEM